MDKQVKELVEWMAERLFWVGRPGVCWSQASNQDYYRFRAKRILSHPALFIKVESTKYNRLGKEPQPYTVVEYVSLADALKGEGDGH